VIKAEVTATLFVLRHEASEMKIAVISDSE